MLINANHPYTNPSAIFSPGVLFVAVNTILVWAKSVKISNKGNNKITELRAILQRESQNS